MLLAKARLKHLQNCYKYIKTHLSIDNRSRCNMDRSRCSKYLSQCIIDISRRIDVNSFISLSIKIEDTEYIPGQIKLCAIGRCVVVNQSKVLSYNFHYWYVHLIIYVYCHNKCTTLLLFKPLGTRVKC